MADFLIPEPAIEAAAVVMRQLFERGDRELTEFAYAEAALRAAFDELGGGVKLIAAERQRQRALEGYDAQHDDSHQHGELANAAASYALGPHAGSEHWPISWRRKRDQDRITELTKAGALIAAEIDRLKRVSDDLLCFWDPA